MSSPKSTPPKALPFALCYVLVPLVWLAADRGGWWIAAPFVWGWVIISLLDQLTDLEVGNSDPETRDDALVWHKAIIWAWVPIQSVLIIHVLWQIGRVDHLGHWEAIGVAAGLGVATGGVGITFAHELIHRPSRWERLAGEFLLVATAYGHFATEHVRGHHVTVGTPADPVSARKGEGFYSFLFRRALPGTLASAWRIDRDRLARIGLPVWHPRNPFWRYGIGLALHLALAAALAGPLGLAAFAVQAFVAVYQLEAVNYVEHYGLQRRYIGNGRFERVGPQHSWNASQKVSNWLLINLQRHSDHHIRPDRRFPLLQHHGEDAAPQLPFSYAVMISVALNPPIWFRVMDKRVDAWRAQFYPDVKDWSDYDAGTVGEHQAIALAPGLSA